jgi:hypothetical protein
MRMKRAFSSLRFTPGSLLNNPRNGGNGSFNCWMRRAAFQLENSFCFLIQ